MRLLANISLRYGVVMLVTALCVLIGGIWTGTKITTDYLLYKDATATARNWARRSFVRSRARVSSRAKGELLDGW